MKFLVDDLKGIGWKRTVARKLKVVVAKRPYIDLPGMAQATAPRLEGLAPCSKEASIVANEEVVEVPPPMPSPPVPTLASTPTWPPTLVVLSPVVEARPPSPST